MDFVFGFFLGCLFMLAVNFFAPSFYRQKIELLEAELRNRS